MYIVASVCARGGSKGIPRKNLRPFLGYPLILRTIEHARECEVLDRLVVSTDDMEIATATLAKDVLTLIRPPELATDTASKWDVFRQVVEEVERFDDRRVDVLVDLDTGCPLRSPLDITECVKKLLNGDADVVVTAYEADRNPYFNMVKISDAGYAHVFSQCITEMPPFTRRQDAPPVWSLSPSVFAIRRDALWKYDHWSASRMQICTVPRTRALDIDTEEDWQYAEWLLERDSMAAHGQRLQKLQEDLEKGFADDAHALRPRPVEKWD